MSGAYNSGQGYKTINWDDVPDPTKREIHGKNRESGAGGISGAYNSGQGYKTINWDDVPDPTKREIHSKQIIGTGESVTKNQGSRHHYTTMTMNGAKEALEEGRTPTAIGQDKGWTIDFTAHRFREPLEPTWKPAPASDLMITGDRYNSTNTTLPSGRFYVNDSILAHTEQNLNGNPYINNLLHMSL